MAVRYAVGNGNWSNVATWDGGVALPTAGDIVHADGKTVTIDQNINVESIRTTQRSGGTAGGSFLMTTAYNITGNIIGGTTVCLTTSFLTGTSTITGNFSVTATGILAMLSSGGGNIVHIGNITSTIPTTYVVQITQSVAYTITGNLIGHQTSTNGNALHYGSTGNLTITGNLIGGQAGSCALSVYSACNVNIVGTLSQVGAGLAISCLTTPQNITITGDATAAHANGLINGIVASIIDITGTWKTSTSGPAVYLPAGTVKFRGNGQTYNGYNLFVCYKLMIDSSLAQTITIQDTSLNNRILYTANATSDFPVISDVRDGTGYAAGALTGTLKVPNPIYVSQGVLTDNTVGSLTFSSISAADVWNYATRTLTSAGTASIDPSAVWNYQTSGLTSSGSIGERLKNCSTVDTTGNQIVSLL